MTANKLRSPRLDDDDDADDTGHQVVDDTDGQPDIMVKVDGRTFRCRCGCNVFRHPRGEPYVYKCNGCNVSFTAT